MQELSSSTEMLTPDKVLEGALSQELENAHAMTGDYCTHGDGRQELDAGQICKLKAAQVQNSASRSVDHSWNDAGFFRHPCC